MRHALPNLLRHPLRSALGLIGVIVDVGDVIATATVGSIITDGLEGNLSDEH